MITLLNQPWREFERSQRRQRICRRLAIACWIAGWITLGLAIGKLLA